ncbi:MAG: hypothetical protein U0798_20225 [Gemmataceae bacterium]
MVRVSNSIEAILSVADSNRDYEDKSRRLNDERMEIWREFVDAITPIRDEWYAAWRAFANDLDQVETAVEALLPCQALIKQFDERIREWHDRASEWLQRASAHHPGFGVPHPFDGIPPADHQLALWACGIVEGGGLQNIICEANPDAWRPALVDGKPGVPLLQLLAHGATSAQLTQYLSAGNAAKLRGITAAIAAATIPPPDEYAFNGNELPSCEYEMLKARAIVALVLRNLDIQRPILDLFFSSTMPNPKSDTEAEIVESTSDELCGSGITTETPAEEPEAIPAPVAEAKSGNEDTDSVGRIDVESALSPKGTEAIPVPDVQTRSEEETHSDERIDVESAASPEEAEASTKPLISIENYKIKNMSVYEGDDSPEKVMKIINIIKHARRPLKLADIKKQMNHFGSSVDNTLKRLVDNKDLEKPRHGVYWLSNVIQDEN